MCSPPNIIEQQTTAHLKSLTRSLVAKRTRSTARESENASEKDGDNGEEDIKEENKE